MSTLHIGRYRHPAGRDRKGQKMSTVQHSHDGTSPSQTILAANRQHSGRRPAAVVLGVLAASAGLVLGMAPAAHAGAVARDVPMAYPLGGEHTVRFGAMTVCHWDEGKGISPLEQALSANAYDLNAPPSPNPFDLSRFFPFNSATVEWTNKDTGRSGRQTVFTVGNEVGVRDLDTGIGDLTVRVTATRSAFPTFDPGSVAPFASATHSEVFEVAGIDIDRCNAPVGG